MNTLTTRDALNALVGGMIKVQARANEVAKDRGYPLSAAEIVTLTTCPRCEETNCTCHE